MSALPPSPALLQSLAAVLASRPVQVLSHLHGYTDLARIEASVAARSWMRRTVWAGVTAALALLAVGMASVAGMLVLFQTDPLAPQQYWVWAPAGVTMLLMFAALWRMLALSRLLSRTLHFQATRRQFAADVAAAQGWLGQTAPPAAPAAASVDAPEPTVQAAHAAAGSSHEPPP